MTSFELLDKQFKHNLIKIEDSKDYSHTSPMSPFKATSSDIPENILASTVPEGEDDSGAFKWGIFFVQLFYHFFYPLSLPLYYYFEGKIAMVNQRLIPPLCPFNAIGCLIFSIYMIIAPLSFWLLVFFFLFLPNTFCYVDFLMATISFIIHRIVVGTKYGYMSKNDYDILHSELQSQQTLADIELLRGWMMPSYEVCDKEIDRAAKRVHLDLTKSSFHILAETEDIEAFLGFNGSSICGGIKESELYPGLKKVCLRPFARSIIRTVSKDHSDWQDWLCYLWGFLISTIGVIVRLIQGTHPLTADEAASGPISIACFCFAFYLTIIFYPIIIRFILVAVYDYKRRWMMLEWLGDLVDPTSRIIVKRIPDQRRRISVHEVNHKANKIFVDLSLSQNLLAWNNVRRLLSNFGVHYRRRLRSILTYAVLIFLFYVGFVVYTYFSLEDHGVEEIAHSTLMILLHVVASMLSLGIWFSFIVVYGSEANEQSDEHRRIMLSIQIMIREQIDSLIQTCPDEELPLIKPEHMRLASCDALLVSILYDIELESHRRPITLFSFALHYKVFWTVIGIIISTTAFTIKMLAH